VSLDPGLHLAPDGLELITVPLDDCFNLIGLVFTQREPFAHVVDDAFRHPLRIAD
jgi:hypothetical protein